MQVMSYCLCLLITLCTAQKITNLSELDGWTLQDSNHSISIPAQGRSQAYIDLYDAGLIGDPLFGFNDTAEAWVQRTNWTYTSPAVTSLKSGNDSSGSHTAHTWLVFEGLDTFTTISMCNQTIGYTNDQFRQYLFDVTDALTACGQPQLSLNFGSATKITHALSTNATGDDGDAVLNGVNSCSPDNEFGCKIYARKEQNDFGWDWSPSLAPAGPWRTTYAVQLSQQHPVYVHNALIDVYREGQMNNLSPDQSQPWVFNASLDFVGQLPDSAGLQLTLEDAAGNTVATKMLDGVYTSNGTITGSTIIDSSSVELWWPNGMGEQVLYTAHIDIVANNATITNIERRVGFRTIVLNLNPITEEQLAQGIAPGANWHFEINGHEMYAKGSNLVPPDAFWPRVNETKIRQLFELVTEGNQNMLRVWSSGAYLADWIYNMADEMGILLWSEFEFSDAEYPTSPAYLENYQAEAYYNIRRVNHHPSLALWVGGNELESIQLAFFFNPDSPSDVMRQYQLIFEELLIKWVYANTRSISYMPSSTYNGYLSLDFNSTRPQLPRYRNTSGPGYLYANSDYYNYDASQAFNLSSYPVARFADEFGFISMPSLQSWHEAAAPDQLHLDSDTVAHHNRHTPFGGPANASQEELSRLGIAEMTAGVMLWYPTPQAADSIANFSAWIYSTQVFQADFYQHQIAFYRRESGMRERQLGSLYWQLDDLWVAPTWSSVEANGRQKMLYYTAKDIYVPVIVYGYYNVSTSELQIWVTSDLWESVKGDVALQWFDWDGNRLSIGSDATMAPSYGNTTSNSTSTDFTVGPINSTHVYTYPDLNATLAASDIDVSNAVLRFSIGGSTSTNNTTFTHTNWFRPAALKDVPLQDPGLTLERIVTRADYAYGDAQIVTFEITATTAVAAWVWIEYETNAVKGYWSENGFWLAKGEKKTLRLVVWEDWSGGDWIDTCYCEEYVEQHSHLAML